MRVYQYMDLVDSVIQRGVRKGDLHTQELRRGGGKGQYVRYAGGGRAGDIQAALFVDLKRWAKVRPTPLWLEVAVKVERGGVLREYEVTDPPGVLYDGHNNRPVFPLVLPLGVEEDEVIEHLLDETMKTLSYVAKCPRDVLLRVPAGAFDDAASAGQEP